MKFKNKYRISGETTTIYYTNYKGKEFEIYIDTEDLDKVKEINFCWAANYLPKINGYYAKCTKKLDNGQSKTLYLHRVIMNAKKGEIVDHINHNTLDNRKSNLRITNFFENNKNRKSKNSNNKSGYRNVCWVGDYTNKWVVQLMVNGKNTRLGFFDDVHEAGKFAEEMRKKYYGEFKGKD